jgi:hypothetical protein
VFEGIVAGIISVLANLLYIDMKRKGRPGLSRIILFWMGTPLTWLWFLLVREGSAPVLEEAPDDAAEILAEIRRDRRLRSGTQGQGSDPPDPPGPWDPGGPLPGSPGDAR